ncbi:uncharacterized protein LOC132042780 [Lycium ferocissimum]|uniref:uncharacterized protein LOC132042780 n=1 Tax=Lycium ferocissimum TaxID=112874 RepID=UPI002815323B|nr:uncharacterized protein LOC132042780 [Lycium ferocissimum]
MAWKDGILLRRLKLAYVLEQPCPNAPGSEVATEQATLIKEQIAKWKDDDYLCKNYILGGMSNKFYDQYYTKCKFAKDIWDTLQNIYLAEEASSKKFLVSNYMEFKMVDDKSITEQVQEFQLIANKIAIYELFLMKIFMLVLLSRNFLPLERIRSKLLHKKEDLTLEQLLQHLQIEQETRYRDNNILKEPVMKAHVVEEKSTKKESHNKKIPKAKRSTNFKRTSITDSKSVECYHSQIWSLCA